MLKRKGDCAILQGVVKGSYMPLVWAEDSIGQEREKPTRNNSYCGAQKRISH